jgi:hypothetical protein
VDGWKLHTKLVEKTDTCIPVGYSLYVSENLVVYEIITKNTAEPEMQ